jgi:hypothetical protein
VQRLLSLAQAVPLVLAVYLQPFAGSQVSVVQSLLSLQTIAVKTHAPVVVLQVSVVQALLSLQTLAVCLHTPLEQVSVVQALLSLSQTVPLATVVPWHT